MVYYQYITEAIESILRQTNPSSTTFTSFKSVVHHLESNLGSQTGKKRRGGPGGLNKLCGVSPELQAIVGHPAPPRTEIVKQLWFYIRKNNLQDPSNKRKIICNDELRLVFETDCTDMFKMNKLLAKHVITLEPTKLVGQNSKKPKVEVESETKNAESEPAVIIFEALANFFGTSGREMIQSEVLRHVWEYIKVNQLEMRTVKPEEESAGCKRELCMEVVDGNGARVEVVDGI
ncbi:Upstream activation factor subunit spp27 [Camellia lanceoleosa]|uniref:Upstream activation factor subunit spp27 n=1 Tax=Camellia lanceoleosa TaxID=1840588 RepID=A0ACC0IJW9_9ERIC|nr:Upstream activation factor subunit spp27 [Camellia lanceoleosa]